MHIHLILHYSSVHIIRSSYAAISTVREDCHLLAFTVHLRDWIYSFVCPTVCHSTSNWKNPWPHLDPVIQSGSHIYSTLFPLWKRTIYLWQRKLVHSSIFLQRYLFH